MSKCTQLAMLLIALIFSNHSFADHLTAKFLFGAKLDGAQEVPALTHTAMGVGVFNLNATRDTLCLEVTFTGLSGPVTGAHIHEGAPGVSGPVVINLNPNTSGNTVKATLTGTTLAPLSIPKLFMGMYYINIHTAANSNGEIRGQILPETDWGIAVMMDGSQENPAVATPAHGLGSFRLAQHMGRLSFEIVVDSLTGPITDAHIHSAPVGVNGGVVQPLGTFVSGNTIIGSVDPTAYLSQLFADSLYVNVHTAANPGGEIRGQLLVRPYLHFDAHLTGGQEVPPIATAAVGEATVSMSYSFDTLWYNVVVNGLSGPITAAHIHKGALGVPGGVLLGFPGPTIMGNTISGMVTVPVIDTFLQFLMEGLLYVNVHTAANPGGEIRGQLYRTFREGYTFRLDGTQEVPAVTTTASGTGLVSIDRDQTNAHFMIAVNDINPTMSHFHNNIPGQNGGVLFHLTGLYANGGVFGYWMDTASTNPFNTSISNKFRTDSMYVNFHTAANPGGEIRGNVSRMLCLPPTIVSVYDTEADFAALRIYPNPAAQDAQLEIRVPQQMDNASLTLTDVAGRKLWQQPVNLDQGLTHITLPAAKLAAGMYMLELRHQEHRQSIRLIKD